jgi:hypothetical protein
MRAAYREMFSVAERTNACYYTGERCLGADGIPAMDLSEPRPAGAGGCAPSCTTTIGVGAFCTSAAANAFEVTGKLGNYCDFDRSCAGGLKGELVTGSGICSRGRRQGTQP